MPKFKQISPKQAEIFMFMGEDYDALICDGAVRSGKTTIMAFAFIEWSMTVFNGAMFAICGKTVRSAERNVIMPLLGTVSMTQRYEINFNRSSSMLTVRRGNVSNIYFIFGGRDESSYALIQGVTLSGVMFDEVALMPQSFVEQAIARTLSVDDAKLWFNCNPENPAHWFYQDWIKNPDHHNAKYLRLLMDDNPSLSATALERAKRSFTGVFYDRYVRGLWVAAEGAIYQDFAKDPRAFAVSEPRQGELQSVNVGVDFGGGDSGHAFVATGIKRGYRGIVPLASKRYTRKDAQMDIDPNKLGELFIEFCHGVMDRHGTINAVYCDSAEQTLIAGLRTSARAAGLPWLAAAIQNALKTTINDRIRATTRLMASGRFGYVREYCKTLEDALSGAVWNPKNKTDDERLDDGTSDIDTLDAFEYSFEREISQLVGVTA